MEHELKQRLIGAVVVTALAAIFIPMLFDDPVDNRAKAVAEMSVPPLPEDQAKQTGSPDKLPANKAQVLTQAEPGLAVSEVEEDDTQNAQSTPDDISSANNRGLESKIEGLPASSGKESAIPEIVPPEEESDQTDDNNDVNPVAVKSEKKLKDKPEATLKKSTSAKVEKEKASEDTKKPADSSKKGKMVRWTLQAGSFSKKENAQAMVDKLRKQGFPASMISKGNLFRIKIGPELDKAKAAEMKSKLASQKIQSYLQAE